MKANFAALLSMGVAFGCKPPIENYRDPLRDAMHAERIGHSVPGGGSGTPTTAQKSKTSKRAPTPGRYGGDVDRLQQLVERNWASRARHEELDAVDVESVFELLRRAVGRSTSRDEFTIAVRRATCRLGDGHLRIEDRSASVRTVTSGLAVGAMNGGFVVLSADNRYDGSRRPRKGDLILAADDDSINDFVRTTCLRPGSTNAHRDYLAARSLSVQSRVAGEDPRPKTLTIRRKGKAREVTLSWKAARANDGEAVCAKGQSLRPGVGLLTLNSFSCPDLRQFEKQLGAALADAGGTEHLIIDLRRNGGGADDQAKAAARRFVSAPTPWMRFRHHVKGSAPGADFDVEPFEPDRGALVKATQIWVLTGPGCFSTCEIFASVLATQPNVTLVGTPTAGGVGNPKTFELPKSKLLVTIPRTEYALPDADERIEGRGVFADVEVHATLDDVIRGRDPVLLTVLGRIRDAG